MATARPIEERFEEKFIAIGTGGCWEWTASKNRENGYGRISEGKKVLKAHRVSWELHNGPIPYGLHVLHTCDNPGCVNPDHLWLGTHQENMADCFKKGRANKRKSFGAQGEGHLKAVLKESDVRKIRRLDSQGFSNLELAKRFGVTKGSIWQIVNRVTWRHV